MKKEEEKAILKAIIAIILPMVYNNEKFNFYEMFPEYKIETGWFMNSKVSNIDDLNGKFIETHRGIIYYYKWYYSTFKTIEVWKKK